MHSLKKLAWLSVFVSLGLATSCNKMGQKQVRSVTPQEAYGMIRNDFAVLVDVREEEEVRQGGIAQPARWVPMSKIKSDSKDWKDFVANLPKNKEIIFYCAVGVRSAAAASLLATQGFKTANLGGFEAWTKAGLPIKTLEGSSHSATSSGVVAPTTPPPNTAPPTLNNTQAGH